MQNVSQRVAELSKLSVSQLRLRYAELFGDQTRAGNKVWLVKRLAWRLQALAEGNLSERARQRAAELANDADLRVTPPKVREEPSIPPIRPEKPPAVHARFDRRLPMPGAIITRAYKGKTLQVTVLPNGFQYQGMVFKSLTAVAKTITGSHVNGYLFFRLQEAKS